MAGLEFRIDVRQPVLREVRVELELGADVVASAGGRGSGQSPGGLDLFLPAWTPGSYLIREFARHLGRVRAVDAESGDELRCAKVAKNRIRITPRAGTRAIRVSWSVYAHELSVRTADLTAEHAYWNHACLLLWPVHAAGAAARLRVEFPADWDLASALPVESIDRAAGHAVMVARDFDHAMDSPCLLGRFRRLQWRALGVEHEVAIDGLGPIEVPPRLVDDLTRIIEQAARVVGGPLPYPRYSFLCLFAADGFGGLEHADSTTLLMGRAALTTEKGYREFLSLAAHELFHAWNVKRLRPVEFWRYDYENENYTEFLWLIEGWTAYYDDLLCLRAGVMTRAQYLDAAAKNVNALLAAPGRFALSLRESSFDAWIRLYRPDENTRNSSQNYYANGAVAAMCLDLWIRSHTGGTRSLDDVLRGLYVSTFGAGRGYGWDDVHAQLRAVAGDAACQYLASLVEGALDPDLVAALAPFGVKVVRKDADRAHLGVHFEVGSTVVASVANGSPAFVAGLQPADEILAVADLRVASGTWSDLWLAVAKVGTALRVLYSRRGRIASCEVVPGPSPGTVVLEVDDKAPPETKPLLAGWLPTQS